MRLAGLLRACSQVVVEVPRDLGVLLVAVEVANPEVEVVVVKPYWMFAEVGLKYARLW